MADKQRSVSDVFFNQACPVCGRTLHVRVHLLGRRVYCQHCGGGFTAHDPALGRGAAVLDRVEDLIARASQALERSACGDEGDSGVSD